MPSLRDLALWSVLLVVTATVRATDWPQWRGPDRNGISRETGWLKGWSEGSSLKVVWRAAVGKGHTAISVASGRAFTLGTSPRMVRIDVLSLSDDPHLPRRCSTIQR